MLESFCYRVITITGFALIVEAFFKALPGYHETCISALTIFIPGILIAAYGWAMISEKDKGPM